MLADALYCRHGAGHGQAWKASSGHGTKFGKEFGATFDHAQDFNHAAFTGQ